MPSDPDIIREKRDDDDAVYHTTPCRERRFTKEKKKTQPRIDRPHVADKTWKVAAAHGRVTTLERDHIEQAADGDAQGW